MAGNQKSKSAAKAKKCGKARQPPPEPTDWEDVPDWNDLPTEVRLEIYKHCFKDAVCYLNDDGIDLVRSKAANKASGQIARASKEIWSESMSFLYCATTLVFNGATQGPAQLKTIPQHKTPQCLTNNLKYIKCIIVTTVIPVALIHRNLRRYSTLQVLRFDFRSLFMRAGPVAGFGKNAHELILDKSLLTRYILEQMQVRWDLRDEELPWKAPINYDALEKLYAANNRTCNRTYKIEVALVVRVLAPDGHEEATTDVVLDWDEIASNPQTQGLVDFLHG